MAKGKLIVIEGLDGSGKATQTQILLERLIGEGKIANKVSFPDYDKPSSVLVKMYLGGDFGKDADSVNPYVASTFYAVDRVASYLTTWQKDYLNGNIILADRYATSNAIYQLSKVNLGEEDAFINWLEDFEYNKLNIPKPDAVIYLDVEPKISQRLITNRYNGDNSKKDIHESNFNFLLNCRKTALYVANKLDWKVIKCDDSQNIRPLNDIANDIYDTLKNLHII